jgi:acetyltransferase
MSEILAMQSPPHGPALAIITNAGGPGVMATDALITTGGQLAPLSKEILEALDSYLPPFWSHANPIDLLGDATPERYEKVVEVCAKDPGIQGLLVLLTPQAMTDPTETARRLAPFARLKDKPILASWMGGTAVSPGRDILNQAGIPTFDSPEAAIRAFLNMVQYKRNQDSLYETPPSFPEDWNPDRDRVRRVLNAARTANHTLLTEAAAKEVLDAYDIPVAQSIPARTADDAAAAARQIGYPVVLKLLSGTLTHKSDVGGVQLNLLDQDEVQTAFRSIQTNVSRHASPDAFDGVTVQPMIRDKGYELIIGSAVDHQFGPILLFGAGGVLVEILQDRALALPPLNRTLARRLIERTQIYRALQGVRGQSPVALDQLEALLVRFSQLVADFLEIQEIDVNPLLASPERIVALDARMVLGAAGLPEKERPQLAIQPYPNQHVTTWRLQDGTEVVIRPIRPEDEPLIVELHEGHSEHTIRMRFFSMVKTLSRDSLIRFCHLDYYREMGLAAVNREGDRSRIMGVSRYYLDVESGDAEFAVVVGDKWQGYGLGYHLMERLIHLARQRGVKRLIGVVLSENETMLRLMRELDFRIQPSTEAAAVEVVLDL